MNKGISLYIHIPFCKRKCFYCDFNSFSGMEYTMLNYAKALSKELSTISRKINTIFIGGGTPTYLSLEALEIIKKSIDNLDKDKDLEFTIEGNPGTFDTDKLKFFKKIGVNRLSIGLQAWQNKILKGLGRIHSREDFLKSFKDARQLGFDNINIDLMFGLPGQTFEDWKETLQEVIKLSPEHVSCYGLIVEEGTFFYDMYKKEKLNLPKEDTERQMYWYTLEYLNKKGYNQYEISNFSRQGKECRHNLVYWNLDEYVGCGSSAHSYVDNFRYRNEDDIKEYIKLISDKGNAVVEKKVNSIKDNMEEFMFMGLRKTRGISIKKFEEKFNISIFKVYANIIKKYENKNLLNKNGEYIYLTPRGIEVSNLIMSDFLLMD